MTLLLYNKPLLRTLAVLAGIGIGLAAWHYVALSFTKLGPGGIRDALAIISFLVAGWLMLVMAEVVDNHYVRAFAALCTGLGGYVSFKWIFLVDGPKLAELPASAQGMRFIFWGFWGAMGCAFAILVLVVARLIVHRATYGRGLIKPGTLDKLPAIGKPATAPAAPVEAELPPIPQDLAMPSASPVLADTAPPPAAPLRQPGPVAKLTAIGGMYLGLAYELSPGDHAIGRQDAKLQLTDDPQVSRRHALLTIKDGGLATLVDAGSTNGTYVNNQRVDTCELAPGDVIRIGTTLFKVEA
jgi:hypothetical protein